MRETEDKPEERRGLAVRYGQFADMLSNLGHIREAEEFLQAAIEFSLNVSDWRVLATNAIRSSALQLRLQPQDSKDELDILLMSLARLRGMHTGRATDVEIAVLRQLARHYSALGDNQTARAYLDEVVLNFEQFERRILDETSGVMQSDGTLSFSKILDGILNEDERTQVREARMVDYGILVKNERSVIKELLDTINSDMRHTGSKRQVNFSRLAVSTVLHDQKGRIDRILSELYSRYANEFSGEGNVHVRVLEHLQAVSANVRTDFNAGLRIFAPLGTERVGEAVSIAQAFDVALERGRFRARYQNIRFQVQQAGLIDFEIAVDSDVLVAVLDNLLQNAATAILASNRTCAYVKVWWIWKENIDQLNPTAYIYIEDSAGFVGQFQQGLRLDGSERFGLKLAGIFFNALRGKMTVEGTEGEKSVLVIELQASELVRRI